jgi:DNA-binding SARP family transcriptional activator
MLELTLFGSVAAKLHYGSEIRAVALAPRSAELLAFLALGRGRFFHRSEIGQSIWGEGEEAGPGSVSTALWRLRKAIERPPARSGEFIASNRQGAVGLNTTASVSSDVEDFEALTRQRLARQAHELTDEDIAALGKAAGLYRDSVLVEFSSEWVLRERERFRRTYLDVLSRLMQIGAVRRDYETAIRYAQLILYTDSLREDVHRDLMRYLVLNGQRALALRQFEICRAALQRELAIPPMRETLLLYQRITENALAPPAANAALALDSALSPGRNKAQATNTRSGAEAAGTEVKVQLEAARQLIAQADSRLQRSLELVER